MTRADFEEFGRPVYHHGSQYRETEYLTGEIWHDGKPVHRKVVDVGALPDTTTKNVAHGIASIETLVRMSGAAQTAVPVLGPLADVAAFRMDATNVIVVTLADQTAYSGHVIIDYTRP